MISKAKVQALRDHLLNDRPGRRKLYVFHTETRFRRVLLEEMEQAGLVEVLRENGSVLGTRITPAGALCYLRALNRAVSKKGRDYFKDFVSENPDFLGRCGPVQRARIEKYLVLGFMPSFSKKDPPSGTQGEETPT